MTVVQCKSWVWPDFCIVERKATCEFPDARHRLDDFSHLRQEQAMNTNSPTKLASQIVLAAQTAQDLMVSNPISIDEAITVHEAAGVLTDRGIHSVPVINDAGRAVGVLSRTDIVRYERETTKHVRPASNESIEDRLESIGFQIEEADRTPVREIMTPLVISVAPEEHVLEVVHKMLSFKVHSLFVVDSESVLVGVISTFDILRKLQAPSEL